MAVLRHSGHVAEDCYSLSSLWTYCLNFEFYLDVVRHMEDYNHAAGGEWLTGIQKVPVVVKNELNINFRNRNY